MKSTTIPVPGTLRVVPAATLVLAALLSGGCGGDPPAAPPGGTAPAPGTTAGTTAAPAPAAPPSATGTPGSPVAPPASIPPARGGPALAFDKIVHDFGEIWDVDDVQCTFPFTNTGSSTLLVSQIKPGCGCTAATLAKRTFSPGEGSEIGITFDPSGFGVQSKTIDVFSNAQPEPIRLTIRSLVKPYVRSEPTYVKTGVVPLGSIHRDTFTLVSPDPGMVVESVRSVGDFAPYLTVRVLDPEPAAPGAGPGSRHPVEVVLQPNAPWGAVYGQIEAVCRGTLPDSGKAISHTIKVTVNASVHGELRATEQMLRAGVVKPGDPFEARLQLTRPSGEPFEVVQTIVESPTVAGMTLRAEPLRTPGAAGYDIILSGASGRHVGYIGGTAVIRTNVPGEEEIRIRIGGVVRDVSKR